MSGWIVQSQLGVTLLGAGEVDTESVAEALRIAPCLVAADGGADRALALGLMPEAVIGDLDSISRHARARIGTRRLHLIAEQETTDFDKCLRSVDAPLILALGFTAPRLDHTLAVFNSLVRHGHVRAQSRCVVIGAADFCFLCPTSLDLDLPVGTTVSLFPFGPVNGTSTGLEWPVDGLPMAPQGRVGTSNAASAARQTLTFDAALMLVILPRAALPAALRALVPGFAPRSVPGG